MKACKSINVHHLTILLIALLEFIPVSAFGQGVGISEISITPDASAILEVRSTVRGFLPPRMTTGERDAIGSPATGLFLYNSTTGRLNYRDGSWISLIASSDNISALSSSTSLQLATLLSDETGSGSAVFATSPTLVTPSLGTASATSINNVTLTNPGTTASLSLANNSTLATSGANSITLTSTGATNVTLPTSGTLYGTAAASITSSNLSTSISDETGSGAIVFASEPTLTGVTLSAGTATVDPLTFTSGTNLTTPAAGAIEYDGQAFYTTPVTSGRGVSPSEHFVSLTANVTGTNGTAAQPVFNNASYDAITLTGSTSYFFEAAYSIARTAGTTSHTMSLSFGGTATYTSVGYMVQSTSVAGTGLGAVSAVWASAATATVVTAASTSATENNNFRLTGIIRVNAGGTLIPQFQYSAAPGGAPTIRANSYFRIYPIGSNTVISVGNWN